MTRDDIIRMAREALKEDSGEDYYAYTHQIPHWWGKEDEIVKFAELVAAAEREACAALCDKIADDDGFEGGYADYCAQAIRKRRRTHE
jgi:hypothetical protein